MYLRWALNDGLGHTYTFPRNPKTMSSPYADRNITSKRTVGGTLILSEGERPAAKLSFEGTIVDKAHFDNMVKWVHGEYSQRVVTLTDHYGRAITGVFSSLAMTPPAVTVAAPGQAWKHTYSAVFEIMTVGAATRGNSWEAI